MMKYEDILKEVGRIRKMLGNVPDPVYFEGTNNDMMLGPVIEQLTICGRLESTCYAAYQLAVDLEDNIMQAIKDRDEADRRWRETYGNGVIETVKAGPEGDVEA